MATNTDMEYTDDDIVQFATREGNNEILDEEEILVKKTI